MRETMTAFARQAVPETHLCACRRDLTANIRAQIQQLREEEEAEKEAVPTYGQTVRCRP